MATDQRINISMPGGALMGLVPEDLQHVGGDQDVGGSQDEGSEKVNAILFMLIVCVGDCKSAPTPNKTDTRSEFMERVRVEAEPTWEDLSAVTGRDALGHDTSDELMSLLFGNDFNKRNTGLTLHMIEINKLWTTMYGKAYTTPVSGAFKHSAQALMDSITHNPDAIVQKLAILFFTLSTEVSVHRYFMGIDTQGLVSTPRVNTERFRNFQPQLELATKKLLSSVRPFVNTMKYVTLLAYNYVTALHLQ